MEGRRSPGEVAVIFTSVRNSHDVTGYAAASEAMIRAAAAMSGYRGVASVRDADGLGITVSYWADHASALAWRDDPDHRRIREAGRGRWYDSYEVVVAEISRSYAWRR